MSTANAPVSKAAAPVMRAVEKGQEVMALWAVTEKKTENSPEFRGYVQDGDKRTQVIGYLHVNGETQKPFIKLLTEGADKKLADFGFINGRNLGEEKLAAGEVDYNDLVVAKLESGRVIWGRTTKEGGKYDFGHAGDRAERPRAAKPATEAAPAAAEQAPAAETAQAESEAEAPAKSRRPSPFATKPRPAGA